MALDAQDISQEEKLKRATQIREEMRIKNEKLQQRHEEVEADRRFAEENNCSITTTISAGHANRDIDSSWPVQKTCSHDEWKAERNKIEEERIARVTAGREREWDMGKSEQGDDNRPEPKYGNNYNRGGKQGYFTHGRGRNIEEMRCGKDRDYNQKSYRGSNPRAYQQKNRRYFHQDDESSESTHQRQDRYRKNTSQDNFRQPFKGYERNSRGGSRSYESTGKAPFDRDGGMKSPFQGRYNSNQSRGYTNRPGRSDYSEYSTTSMYEGNKHSTLDNRQQFTRGGKSAQEDRAPGLCLDEDRFHSVGYDKNRPKVRKQANFKQPYSAKNYSSRSDVKEGDTKISPHNANSSKSYSYTNTWSKIDIPTESKKDMPIRQQPSKWSDKDDQKETVSGSWSDCEQDKPEIKEGEGATSYALPHPDVSNLSVANKGTERREEISSIQIGCQGTLLISEENSGTGSKSGTWSDEDQPTVLERTDVPEQGASTECVSEEKNPDGAGKEMSDSLEFKEQSYLDNAKSSSICANKNDENSDILFLEAHDILPTETKDSQLAAPFDFSTNQRDTLESNNSVYVSEEMSFVQGSSTHSEPVFSTTAMHPEPLSASLEHHGTFHTPKTCGIDRLSATGPNMEGLQIDKPYDTTSTCTTQAMAAFDSDVTKLYVSSEIPACVQFDESIIDKSPYDHSDYEYDELDDWGEGTGSFCQISQKTTEMGFHGRSGMKKEQNSPKKKSRKGSTESLYQKLSVEASVPVNKSMDNLTVNVPDKADSFSTSDQLADIPTELDAESNSQKIDCAVDETSVESPTGTSNKLLEGEGGESWETTNDEADSVVNESK